MINRLTGKDEKSVKVVIEILEDDYKNLMLYKDHSDGRSWAEIAIIDGTILPKGHGRLIDVDDLLTSERPKGIADDVWKESHIYKLLSNEPTIIEAERSNDEYRPQGE